MDAHKRTLEEILSPAIRLVAPLFQRPYVWNEEANWTPLWRALEEQSERRRVGSPRPYFLGALVLDELKTPLGTAVGNRREIIDGQQRLTTLQILFRASIDVLTGHGLDFESETLRDLVFNKVRERNDERYKIWPTNVDRDGYRCVMEGTPSVGRMRDAYDFFHAAVSAYLCDQDSRAERAAALTDVMTSGLVFAAIDLDANDDSQLIFETLNSLGTPLLPSDLVKNLLFRQAQAEDLPTNELYQSYWEPFEKEESYWRGEVGVGRRLRTRLDFFLQNYLALKLTREPISTTLFRSYREAFADGRFGTTEEALRDLARHAELFRAFDEHRAHDLEGNLRRTLNAAGTTTPFPLVLGILASVADEEERGAMFGTLESYVARRTICNLTLKNLNKVVYEAIVRLNASGWSNATLRDYLLSQEAHTTRWPHDEWIRDAVYWKAAYNAIGNRKVAYLLARYEGSLRTSWSEVPGTAGLDWGRMTVEHVLPQKWREHWPLPESASTDSDRHRDESVHRFGNLTLLMSGLNASISNGPWAKKKESMYSHSQLLMNGRLVPLESWNEDEIYKRGQEIAAAFCRIWPRD